MESDITTNGARNGGYQYVWSPRYIDAPILRDTLNTAGNGHRRRLAGLLSGRRQLQRHCAGQRQRPGSGALHLHALRRGDLLHASWTTAGSSANANTTLYAGRELELLALYYNRARYYDPSLERFVTDPMG